MKTVHIDQPKQNDSRYYYVSFDVAPDTRRISISYDYDRANGSNTLDLGLFDPQFSGQVGELAGFRGWSGGRRSEIFVSEETATPGYLPGEIQAGTWRVILGLYRVIPAGVDVTLKIELETDESKATKLATATQLSKVSTAKSFVTRSAERKAIPAAKNAALPRWVSGDLHLHTVHSDGDWTASQLVKAAAGAGLDFICITDHNTNSYHSEIDTFKKYPLVIRGEEITTYGGHANAWGLPKNDLIDFRVTPGDQVAMSRVVVQTHQLGALISINHPFGLCAGCVWDYDKDATGFDAVEVWNGTWDSADELALGFWDRLLQKGRRITAIASSDSHRVENSIGQAATHVAINGNFEADALLKSIRAGRVYLSNMPTTPVVKFEGQDARGRTYSIGDVIRLSGSHHIRLKIAVAGLPESANISLISNGKIVRTLPAPVNGEFQELEKNANGNTYFRVEVRAQNGAMLALTNPIYVAL
jgi:predicted metal-dependent phosphoesterase TrpH